MVMVADVLPGLKRWLKPLGLTAPVGLMVTRLVAAFVHHVGRMSCLQAAGSIRCEPRHRGQVSRMLRRASILRLDILSRLRRELLAHEASGGGLFIFLVDATLCSQQGKKTENTFSAGNRQRRPKKGRRYGKTKRPKKSCHSFTMGLLITPSGLRLPFSRCYYTDEYCRQTGRTHRTTAESAADLVRQLPLPPGARVMVLGDTAYDSHDVRSACQARGYSWIFPCNPERVLAGPKPRPKVRSLLQDWSQWSPHTIRLFPGQGKYVAYRRLSPHRVGPKAKPRTYYVHQERRAVHSVGPVQLVFSTTQANLQKATPDNVKILMTSDLRLSPREVVELYSLRWQIELFFKELKSTLGFHQYRFQKMESVESWCELALLTFLFLESYRREQLGSAKLTAKEKKWWRHQRTHGLCHAVRQASAQSELVYLSKRLNTCGGVAKLKKLLRDALPAEYRANL